MILAGKPLLDPATVDILHGVLYDNTEIFLVYVLTIKREHCFRFREIGFCEHLSFFLQQKDMQTNRQKSGGKFRKCPAFVQKW